MTSSAAIFAQLKGKVYMSSLKWEVIESNLLIGIVLLLLDSGQYTVYVEL